MGKPPQWVEDLLADQLSYQGTGTNGESEAVCTSDLEDGDANCSESDQSDADIDEENSTDTEGQHTEDTGQSNTSPYLVTHERTVAPYSLQRNPRPTFKVLESQARD